MLPLLLENLDSHTVKLKEYIVLWPRHLYLTQIISWR